MAIGNKPFDSNEPEGGEFASERAEESSAAFEIPPGSTVDVIELVNVLIQRWRLVFGLPFVACVLTAVYSLTVRPTFTATAHIVPETPQATGLPSGLTGLASQFGFAGASAGGSRSPQFYAEVLTSFEIMERTLRAQYADPRLPAASRDSTSLLELLEIDERESFTGVQRGVRDLRGLVGVSVDQQTNIIQVSVDAQWPSLAAAVANRIIATLNEFNEQTRRSQAGERRRFIEERGTVTQMALDEAEQDIQVFYESNRTWQQSPQLTVEERRLRRVADLHQELYLTLMREHELALIQEVNEVPIITVIDRAVPPLERSRPRRRRMVLLVALLSGMLGAAWALAAEYFAWMREVRKEGYVEFSRLLGQVGQNVRRVLRLVPLGRRGGGNAGD